MKLRRTAEDYLKTIYLLSQKAEVHGTYIAEALGVSKPTVSISLKALEQEGYLMRDENRAFCLTEAGLKIAKATYERHQTFQTLLEELGRRRKNSRGGRQPNGARGQPGKLRGQSIRAGKRRR